MKTLTSIVTWIRDHTLLVLLGAGAIVGFIFLSHFAELFYSTIKLTAVVVLASLVMHFAFPQTLHRYINDGQLMTDFHALDSKHKVWSVLVTLGVLFLVSAICFVHA